MRTTWRTSTAKRQVCVQWLTRRRPSPSTAASPEVTKFVEWKAICSRAVWKSLCSFRCVWLLSWYFPGTILIRHNVMVGTVSACRIVSATVPHPMTCMWKKLACTTLRRSLSLSTLYYFCLARACCDVSAVRVSNHRLLPVKKRVVIDSVSSVVTSSTWIC